MARWRYLAVSADGLCVRGQHDASTATLLEAELQAQRLTLLRASKGWPALANKKVSRHALMNFCFHFGQLLKAGIPMLDALSELQQSESPAALQTVLAHIRHAIQHGLSLSQALAQHQYVFSDVFVQLIRAGEESGSLVEVLGNLEATLRWQDEAHALSARLMLYPTFLLILLGGVTGFIVTRVLPQLALFLKASGFSLPWHTRLLLACGDFLGAYGLLLVSFLLALICVGLWARQRYPLVRLYWDDFKLKLPLLGPLQKKFALAEFTKIAAMLYRAGLPILSIFSITAKVCQNRKIQLALHNMQQHIESGSSISQAFAQEALFPSLLLRMVQLGEKTGQLDTSLEQVAYCYEREVKESIARLHTLMEPTLTVIFGLVLGWIVMSVMGPLYDTMTNLGRLN